MTTKKTTSNNNGFEEAIFILRRWSGGQSFLYNPNCCTFRSSGLRRHTPYFNSLLLIRYFTCSQIYNWQPRKKDGCFPSYCITERPRILRWIWGPKGARSNPGTRTGDLSLTPTIAPRRMKLNQINQTRASENEQNVRRTT